MSEVGGLTIAVTGGAGFIGSHLVERIVEAGPSACIVIDDLSTGSLDNLRPVLDSIHFVEGDICAEAVAAQLSTADLVFHLAVRNVRASIAHPAENLRVNANGTLAALEAMRTGNQGRFVYVSSSEVYGLPESGLFSEEIVPAPTTVYGAGKLAGELIAQAYHRTYGMDTRVIRPFNNFGPRSHFEGDSGEVIPKFILRALADRPLLIHGDGRQTRDFMYVEDTARWLMQLAGVDELIGDVVNIGSGLDTSVAELATMILAATGSASDVIHGEERPGDLPKLRADVTKVSSIVPFELSTDLAEGLRRTIAFFADQDVEELLSAEVERNWI
jgi:UDP-glucose 4-epimerase